MPKNFAKLIVRSKRVWPDERLLSMIDRPQEAEDYVSAALLAEDQQQLWAQPPPLHGHVPDGHDCAV
jgi:hypothetical protein